MRLPWKYILVSLLIGLVAGGAAGLFYSNELAHEWMRKSPDLYLRRLDRQLHFDDAQRTQIRSILYARHDKVAAYEDVVRKEARAALRVVLKPEQQSRFDELVAKHDAERRKREVR